MRICLLRHGETDWNNSGRLQGREDVPLNAKGIEQVKESAKYLGQFRWEAIITSPLARAKTSAEIISRETGNTGIEEDSSLTEKDYGKASGMTLAERKAAFPDGKYTGAESSEALRDRMMSALFKHIKKHEGNNIIVVSHGAAINSIVACLTKTEIDTAKTVSRNAGMTLLEKAGEKISVVYFNKVANELAEN